MNIKPGLEEEYEKYVKINSEDEYSKVVISAGENVGKLLDEGKSPEEAEKGLHGFQLTGYMAGAVVSIINHFHPRGEEMNSFWNKSLGGTGEEKDTINPAILTIKE